MINQITGKLAICEATDIIPINISNGAIHYDCVLNVDQIDHPGERELCESLGITYIWQPVPRKRTKTNAQFSHYKRILVHCYAGFDRAPFVVAKYLSSVAALSIPQAYSIIKQQRPIMEHYEWI
jgi:hypothetical protein